MSSAFVLTEFLSVTNLQFKWLKVAMDVGHRIADSADVSFELDLEKSGLELGITWLYMRLK